MPSKQENCVLSLNFYLILAGCLTAGFFLGLASYSSFFTDSKKNDNDCISNLKFIRPNLDCAISDKKLEQLSELQTKLETVIPVYIQSKKATRIGVFVRDLTSTRFAGVNENDNFVMASLMKAPLLIAGYKLAEVEPKILDQEITYTGIPDLYENQNFPTENRLKKGQSYSIKELMKRSVAQSDNTASEILYQSYPEGFFDRILNALGLQIRFPDGEAENFTTPRTYANIFRSLYNASYLTREYSEEALKNLTETEYKNGVVALLPKSVIVAHKFAERTVLDEKTGQPRFRQLHECGIVYADGGKNPYTFCIMTEGNDFVTLEKIQQDISLEIYNSMTKHHR